VQVVSVNVGQPREVTWRGRQVRTAIWKHPVSGRVRVGRLNVEGDAQADLLGHGGEQRAVFVYQVGSYRYWERQLGRSDFVYGQFGENLTVDGLSDDEVCVGDRYRIGTALFEVTQPRVTCYKVGIRLDEPRMPALLTGHGRPGFYLRVLEEGTVGAGDPIAKVAPGPGGLTVHEVSDLLYMPGHPTERLEQALRIEALSPGWRASFEAMLEQARAGANGGGNPGLTPARTGPPAWSGFRPFRVAAAVQETDSVRSLVLERADGTELAGWHPGQFVTLRLTPAGSEAPLLRTYSVSAPPHPRRLRISVRREPAGRASGHLHTAVAVGDVLDVAAPRGSFTIVPPEGAGSDRPADEPLALVSAGIGVTPVLAMLGALVEAQSRRPVWWVHGARGGAQHAFAHEARALVAALPGARSHVRYSRPEPADRLGRDYAAAGRVTARALAELGVPVDAQFYLCGPLGFLREISSGLAAWGVTHDRVHREVFGPESAANGGPPPHPPPGRAGADPPVTFARSNLSVAWDPAYGSLLELAEACDVPAQWSCRTGVCHRCESGLVDGDVEYEPNPLEPPAPGHVLLCCSRPSGAVSLDL